MVQPAILLESQGPTSRRVRRPRHKFTSYHVPFGIYPLGIAPVLPGETLTGIYFEAREVSKPLSSSVLGWGSEYYVFYCRIRDLPNRDNLDDLFINPAGATLASTAANANHYYGGRGYNFTEQCLQRVVETYFRDDGETWNTETVATGVPSAQVLDQMWLDSVVDTTVLTPGTGSPAVDATTPEALDVMMEAYDYLRSMSLTSMSFEDYVATFGVRILKLAQNKPILVKRWKEFVYPSNTVEPTTGVPTAAASWVFKESCEGKHFATGKSLFVKEPGFLFMCHVVRPKVYMKNIAGSLSHHLDTGLSWLPAIMSDHPETSLREFTNANGPITGATNGYWLDMRDLFLYGDQFTNAGTPTVGVDGVVGVPTAALKRKYLAAADRNGLFAVGTNNWLTADGYMQFSIKGSQQDYTRGMSHEF